MIGWENDRGAYFINKLNEALTALDTIVSSNTSHIGKMSNLTTKAKDTLVKALNEVKSLASNAYPVHTVHNIDEDTFAETYKYDDGRLITNIRHKATVEITSTSGSGYYGTIDSVALPIEYKEKPTVVYSCEIGSTNAFVWGRTAPSTTGTGGLYAGRFTSATGNIVIDYHIEGYWK